MNEDQEVKKLAGSYLTDLYGMVRATWVLSAVTFASVLVLIVIELWR